MYSRGHMRTVRYLTLSLLSVLLLVLALPGASTEDAPAEVTDTTVVAETNSESGYQPAVVVEPAATTPAAQAWTTKFLVPTGLLIAAVAMLATVVMYFIRVVRTRYKVVE